MGNQEMYSIYVVSVRQDKPGCYLTIQVYWAETVVASGIARR